MSIEFDLAGHVRLRLESADEALRREVARQLDPYLPAPASDAATGPSVRMEPLEPHAAELSELQLAAGDGFVTGTDGSALFVLAGARRASVPDALRDEPSYVRVDPGYPLAGLFRSVVRPAVQLRALAGGSVAVHAAAVAVDGRAVLVAGWSESGKTESALALLEEGARFVSDKWTFLAASAGDADGSAPSLSAAAFPINVGVRRWVLRYLPRLRSAVPTRARARLTVAGAFGAVTAPVRSRRSGRLGMLGAGATRLVALADRAALSPSEIAEAYGHPPIRERVPVGLVAVLRTTPAGTVSVREADGARVAGRLATSAITERAAYHALRTRARYALGTEADPGEVAALEAARLGELLDGVPVVEVSAPFPTDPRRVAAALEPWLHGGR
jgi:hypothetical protein